MEKLIILNGLREKLKVKELELSAMAYVYNDDLAIKQLAKATKHRKETEKMIFSIIATL